LLFGGVMGERKVFKIVIVMGGEKGKNAFNER